MKFNLTQYNRFEYPKMIYTHYDPVDQEDIDNKQSSFRVKENKLKMFIGGWHWLLLLPIIVSLMPIASPFWLIYNQHKSYNNKIEIITYVVDNKIEPTQELEDKGYNERYARIYEQKGIEALKESAEDTYLNDGFHFLFWVLLLVFLPLGVFTLSVVLRLISISSIELDRMEGTIKMDFWYGLKKGKANFKDDNEVVFKIKGTIKYGNLASLVVYFKNTNTVIDTGLADYKETISLFTHFMDKNRPLPAGTAFDPYRAADDARREKEGEKRPMYRSLIKNKKEG